MTCSICNHVFAQKHRILPGQWGGAYIPENVVLLCPNHHQAIHFLMRWYYRGGLASGSVPHRLAAYADDRPLWVFWLDRVRPVVQERMQSEDRWHPGLGPEAPYPAKNGPQKQRWEERKARIWRDEDQLTFLDLDIDYLGRVFDFANTEILPDEVRAHPVLRNRSPEYIATLIGVLIGRGHIRNGSRWELANGFDGKGRRNP